MKHQQTQELLLGIQGIPAGKGSRQQQQHLRNPFLAAQTPQPSQFGAPKWDHPAALSFQREHCHPQLRKSSCGNSAFPPIHLDLFSPQPGRVFPALGAPNRAGFPVFHAPEPSSVFLTPFLFPPSHVPSALLLQVGSLG